MPRDWYRADQRVTISESGTVGTLSLVTSAQEVRVGATPFSGRKMLSVFNNTSDHVYWGFNSATATSGAGYIIPANTGASWTLTQSVAVWVVGSGNVRIMEAR
jgi:hypothetical protein